MAHTIEDADLAQFVAAKIKTALRESSLTYEAAGERVGVSKPAVGKWTRSGKIELANLYRLAQATGKPIGWFFPGYDESAPPDGGPALREDIARARASGNADLLDDLLLQILEAKRAMKDA